MTQIQALGLVVAFVMALSLILTVALFITALAYEARAALARRRSRRLRANVGSYTITGRWSA